MNRFDDVREFFTQPRLLSVDDEPERFGAPIINTASSILMPGCGNSPFCMYIYITFIIHVQMCIVLLMLKARRATHYF